jgi:hypothetical protein
VRGTFRGNPPRFLDSALIRRDSDRDGARAFLDVLTG